MRIIKKYDNRSLYDTEISENISVNELKQYVIDSIPFQVVNAKTGEDVTRSYLLQIILEMECAESPLFSQAALEQIIKFYGGPLQGWLQTYIEKSFEFLSQQQKTYSQTNPNFGQDFFNSLAKSTAENLYSWHEQFSSYTQKKS